MRILKPLLLCLALICGVVSQSQTVETDSVYTLSEYLADNPDCITQDVIYDGCTMNINSDGEYLFGQLTILHPELQMRILMQGLTFFVDPTGKKKEKYALHFPAASAVEDVMQRIAPAATGPNRNAEEVPDISPLISALDKYGVRYEINGRDKNYENDWATISLDPEEHALTYTFIIPVEDFLTEKKISDNWKIGMLSEGGNSHGSGPGNGPGMGAPGMGEPTRGMTPPKGRERNRDEQAAVNLRKMMMKDIEAWVAFSYSNICSLNE